MNTNRVTLILLALMAALVLSSCAGGAASRGSSWPGLAADAKTAYLSDGAQIFAVRLSDGTELWKYPAKADAKTSFYATPALLGDGRLVIGSAGSDHCLYLIDATKVDAATHTPAAVCIFSGSKDRWIAAPLVEGNTVYAPNNYGFLYVVDLSSSQLLWSLEIGGGGHLWAAPVINGDTLYISSLDHFVYAIDIPGRKVLNKKDLNGSVTSAPAVSADGKTLYVGSFASKVFAVDAASLEILWQEPTQGWAWGTPALDGQTVYVADLEGELNARNAADGSSAWVVKPDGPITGSPLLAGDNVIVTTESGSIYAFNTKNKGEQAWNAAIKGKIYTPAVQGGDLILIAPLSTGAEYLLTAFKADGTLAWNYPRK